MNVGVIAGGAYSAFDPYWNYVSFLLHGQGADGSTVFTDSSMYARPIAALGAVQNDTDIVVADTPSMKFDADANYLNCTHGFELNITTTSPDFCMETYAYFTGFDDINDIYGRRRDSNNYKLYVTATGIVFATYSGTTQTTRLNAPHSMAINTVYHIAVCRSGTDYYAFVDGVLVGSSSSPTPAMAVDTTNLYIGNSETNQGLRFMRGNLNWMRITIGHYRYNLAGFARPAVPYPMKGPTRAALPAATFSNVTALFGFSGADNATTTTDESSYGRTPTFVGNAKLSSTQTKFGTSALLLDGAGDYVTIPDATELSVASGDFCIEAWVYTTATKANQSTISGKRATTSAQEHTLLLLDGKPQFYMFNAGTAVVNISANTAISNNTWHHIAVSREGSFCRLFVDGIQVGACVQSAAPTSSTADLMIGRDNFNGGRDFNGYISEYRFTKGQPVYTANFTVPTAAFPRS